MTKRRSTTIASQPLTADASTPTIIGAERPCSRIAWGSLSTAAAAMIGMLIRKLNTAASSRVRRSARPPVMVAPERETPGMMANIWASPTINASIQRIEASVRSRAAKRSTAQSSTPITIRAEAMSRGSRKELSACFSSARPAMAPGTVAMMRYSTRRSRSVSTRRLTTMSFAATSKAAHSERKYQSTATRVPK